MSKSGQDDLKMELRRLKIRGEKTRDLSDAKRASKRIRNVFSGKGARLNCRTAAPSMVPSARAQRVTVKVRHVYNAASKSWSAHGSYLAREGAAREGEKGLGFDQERDDVDLVGTLKAWQEAGDPLIYKMMISPEFGERLDVRDLTQKLISRMESDLDTRFEYVAIVHTNTGRPHAHLVLRWVDERGAPRHVPKEYLSHGIRQRAREIATQELGHRSDRDVSLARERAVTGRYFGELDRGLVARANTEREISYEGTFGISGESTAQRLFEIRRLHQLKSMGLAEQTGIKSWRLSEHLEGALRELQLASDLTRSMSKARAFLLDREASLRLTSLAKPGVEVTGRVIATGLDDAGPEGRRFILLEGTDGLAHYVPQTAGIEVARGKRQLRQGSVVTLSSRSFQAEGRSIHWTEIQDYGPWAKGAEVAVDRYVMEFVSAKGELPELNDRMRGFAREWRETVAQRAAFLERELLVERTEGGLLRPVPGWESKLDRLHFSAVARDVQAWEAASATGRSDPPVLGVARAVGVDGLLIESFSGTHHLVARSDIERGVSASQGETVWVRAKALPNDKFSSADARIADHLERFQAYEPARHLEELQRDSSFQSWAKESGIALEDFVLGHQRRAENWARWGVLEEENGAFRLKEEVQSVEDHMKAKLAGLHERLRSDPAFRGALLSRLTPEALEASAVKFSTVDRVLASIKRVPEGENAVLQKLREQEERWRRRGILVATDDFENQARRWLEKNREERTERTIQETELRHGRSVEVVEPEKGKEIRGKVVGFGKGEGRSSGFVIIDDGNRLRAVRSDKRGLEIGQEVRARGDEIAEQARRRTLQATWRLDDLQQLRAHDKAHGR